MIRIFWLFLLYCLVFARIGKTAELYQYGETVRSFGMGGVRIPTSTEPGNFLWNPAALAFNDGVRVTVFNFGGGLNGTQAVSYAQSFSGGGSGVAALSPFYGKPLWVGGGAYAAAAVPYFGLAYYTSGYLDFILQNPAFPNIDMTYISDYGTVMGGALPLGRYGAVGMSVKRIVRTGGTQKVGASTLASLSNPTALLDSLQNKGSALGFDLGVMFRAEDVPLNPTFSFAWQDVGSTAFAKIGGVEAPPLIKDNQTASVTFDADSLLAGLAAGIEYRHIGNASEQIGKKLHAGVEMSIPMLDLRAGFYQGYTTYGLGLDLWLMQMDLSSYTVEKGAYPGQTPDGRIQFGLSVNLGFNPNFELVTVGGKGRKVKQRR